MIRTMYSSVAVDAVDEASLHRLVEQSRANNERDGITGALVYRDARFLQVLEGPDDAVTSRMAVISRDPRHHRVRTLLTQPAEVRAFATWTMGFRELDDEAEVGDYGEAWGESGSPARTPEREWLLIVERLTHWYRESTATSA